MPPNKHMTPAAAVVAPGKGTEEHEDEERRREERGDVSIRGMEAGREKGVIGNGDDMVFNPEVGRARACVRASVTPDL